jgi:trehalose 6-phosphate phosphatase
MSADLLGHLTEVAREIRAAPLLLLCLDFDGALAPMVPDPDSARMPDDTRAVLRRLLQRPRTVVAVVSGRALPDLAARVGMDVILVGNHGFEIEGPGFQFRHAGAEASSELVHGVCVEIAERTAGVAGVLVEDKGITASVHHRNVDRANRDEVVSIVQSAVAPHHARLEVREGNAVVEILPRIEWDEASAIRWISERLPEAGVTCYLGEAARGEDVFRAIEGITVRVGEPAPTAARFRVCDTVEAASFLRWLMTAPI